MPTLLSKYGQWALITGASSGIGRAFALQLAQQGFSLVLVARNQKALEQLATELKSKYQAETMIVASDLSTIDAVSELYSKVSSLNIGLLIPSAGIDEMGKFIDKDYELIEKMLFLNVQAPTKLAHLFGQKMKDRERAAIILVSSIFAYQGIPNFAAYAASKSYILTLGETLNVEMSKHGIDVLVLSPGLTDTPFSQSMPIDFSKIPMIAQQANQVARTGLKHIGKKPTVVSGVLNKFYAWENRLIPRSWPVKLFGFLINRAMKSHTRKSQLKT